MLSTNPSKKFLDIATGLLVLVPILIFLRYVYVYALNIPRQDDYDAILNFLVSYSKPGAARLSLLMQQHNEHRIFSPRLVYVLYYKLTGTINFRHIIFINAALLISLFLVVAHFIRKAMPAGWHAAVLCLSLCLFGLNSFENMNFAMAGMQNYGVILLMAASLYCYTRPARWAILPAVLLQGLCVFSSGNGNLAAAFILLYNILSKDRLRTIVCLSAFLVFTPLYYYGYSQPPSGFFTLSPSKFLPFFLHVAGAHFSYDQGIPTALLLITVLLISLPVGKRFKIAPKDLPLLTIAGFILGSVAIMSVFRGNMPIGTAYSSRYFIYPALLTSLTATFVMIKNNDSKWSPYIQSAVAVLLLLCYNWNTRDGKGGFKGFNEELRTMQYHYPDPARAKSIADEACALKIYCLDLQKAAAAK